MRQAQREIVGLEALEAVIATAQVCRLALQDDGFPYIVPLNFGYAERCLFFHCAPEGKKLDLIRKDPRVGFELESVAEVMPHPDLACRWTTRFQSVIGRGRAFILTDPEEQRRVLDVILAHYSAPGRAWNYPPEHLSKMVALRVDIEAMTGKQSKDFAA
jgi:hypothetical protein